MKLEKEKRKKNSKPNSKPRTGPVAQQTARPSSFPLPPMDGPIPRGPFFPPTSAQLVRTTRSPLSRAARHALAPPLIAPAHTLDAPSHAHASPALFPVSLTARPHLSASSPSFPSSSRQRAPLRPRRLLRCLWTPARPCRPTSKSQRIPPCLLEATHRAPVSRRAVSTIRFLRDLLRHDHRSRF